MTVCVDASALLAIALGESDGEFYAAQIRESDVRVMNPVNYWESMVRMHKETGEPGLIELDELIVELGILVIANTQDDARLAARTFVRFGKNHRAKLNLGDCFAYATARANDAKLIFKGNDFPQTDIIT